MGEKLVLKRDYTNFDFVVGRNESKAPATPKENQKAAEVFLKDAITQAGLEARKKIEFSICRNDDYIKVFIKGFGGNFFLECCIDYDSAGGSESKDEVKVDSFILNSDDVCYSLDDLGGIEYTSRKDIIKNLAADINKYAGVERTLSKGEARKTKVAA